MSKNLIVIPWNLDFIPAFKDYLVQQHAGDFRNVLILFPHRRPRRTFIDAVVQDPTIHKPCFLPDIVTISGFFARLRNEHLVLPQNKDTARAVTVGIPDRIHLMHRVLQNLRTAGHDFRFPLDDQAAFFPWGIRLARLMEELFHSGKAPRDITHPEEQVEEFAQDILTRIGTIFQEYVKILSEDGLTTPGFDAYTTVQDKTALKEITEDYSDTTIYSAGFHTLTGVQKELFHFLSTNHDTNFIVHSDPALADGGELHWTCKDHRVFAKSFSLKPVLYPENPSGHKTAKNVRFLQGFDLHSQLDRLHTGIQEAESTESTVIVLPDSGLLMPVLHHLPQREVNIGMGYPLQRTVVNRLLESIMTVRENADNGSFQSKDIITLIRHPYLKMLTTEDGTDCRSLFHQLEEHLRTKLITAEPTEFFDSLEPDEETIPGAVMDLGKRILQVCIQQWLPLQTLSEMAEALQSVCDLLLERGREVLAKFPVDEECLHRLLYSVIPSLNNTLISKEVYGQDILFSLLRETIASERVPFEGDPPTGLQILGLRETRLLGFHRVHIIDAIESKLPGGSGFDPLTPDSIRRILGLPDERERNRAAGYLFFRLYHCSDYFTVYYQSTDEPGGLFEERALRSRFLEELIWEEEKRKGKLLTPQDPPLDTVAYPIHSIPREMKSIQKTPAVRNTLAQYLEKNRISATMLDEYLHCPASFFYKRIARIRPPEEAEEGFDHKDFGSLMHTFLKDTFAEYQGREIDPGTLNINSILKDFSQRLHSDQDSFFQRLTFDEKVLTEKTALMHLKAFFKEAPTTTILKMEDRATGTIHASGKTFTVDGVLDRIDQRNMENKTGILILDYKTGSVRTPKMSFWSNVPTLQHINDPQKHPDELAQLSEDLKSVQLPLYLYLYRQQYDIYPINAGFIELKNKGKESFIFDQDADSAFIRNCIDTSVLELLKGLLDSLINAAEFFPIPGKHCSWCHYRTGCGAELPQTA